MDQICAGQGKTSSSGKIDTVSDFLTELGRVVGDQSAVIVLEGAERLREEGSFLQVCFTPFKTVVHSEHVVLCRCSQDFKNYPTAMSAACWRPAWTGPD